MNVQEAHEKLERMQYVCKKAERNVDVERRTLEEERACIQLSLRKNVSKIHSNMKRMTDMSQQQKKLSFNVRAVTHRLNFEKEVSTFCSIHRLSVYLYLISFFLFCV